MPRKECLSCRRLYSGSGSYCAACTAARYRTTTQRGLGHDHRKIVAALLADNPVCYWCGKRPATTGDHLVPRSLGGTNDPDNYVPACSTCNYGRGNRGHVQRGRAVDG